MKRYIPYLLLTSAVLLIASGCTSQNRITNTANSNTAAPTLPATSDVVNVLLADSNGSGTTTASLVLKNGNTVPFGNVPVLTRSNDHWFDYRNGRMYGERFIAKGVGDYTRDFIRVDSNGKITSLFQGSAARGRVSPDEQYAAVTDNVEPENIVFINLSDLTKKEVLLAGAGEPAVPHIVFQGWSSDSTAVWARTESYADPQEFYRITPSGRVARYQVPSEVNNLSTAFNPDTAQVLYDTFPVVPAMDIENVKKSGVAVQLYLYNVVTGEKKLIATSQGKQFNAKWESVTVLSYDDPVTRERTTRNP